MTSALDLPVAGPVSPLLSRPGLQIPAFASIPESRMVCENVFMLI